MVTHEVVLTTAVAGVSGLLFIAVFMLRSGDLTMRRAWIQRTRAGRPALRDLDTACFAGAPDDSAMPSVDQVAAELQRLYRQRTNGTARGSVRLHTALADAYDEWLQVACLHFDVIHHLPSLDGLDRDLERVRIEAALTAAGLRLPPR